MRSGFVGFCLGLVTLVALRTTLPAQTGVIAFGDGCTQLLYAMPTDKSGKPIGERIQLPLPPLPAPIGYRYSQPTVLEVTRSGPLTVIYYVGITSFSQNVFTPGLFAVQLNVQLNSDGSETLVPDTPVPLLSSHTPIDGVDPNTARHGSISANADRLALVADSSTASVLMTAQIVRDSTLKIIGLSDLVSVGDLYSLNGVSPNPDFPDSKGFTGTIAYSLDGTSIVASIYYDLWTISLSAVNTFLSVTPLTDTTDQFAGWNPDFSPGGSRMAYTGAPISGAGTSPTVRPQNMNIYSLTLAPPSVIQVTNIENKGTAATDRDHAMFSPDGEWIAFTALTTKTPHNLPCSALVNSDIFLINSNGSSTAVDITNTNGTSVEVLPRLGWQ